MAQGKETYKCPEDENIGKDGDKKRLRNILRNLPKRVVQSFEPRCLHGLFLLKQREFRESHSVYQNVGCPRSDFLSI
jgi:hypothetical protein